MSTQQVSTEIMGHPVSGTVVDERTESNIRTGPRDILVIDVGSGRYVVPADDVE